MTFQCTLWCISYLSVTWGFCGWFSWGADVYKSPKLSQRRSIYPKGCFVLLWVNRVLHLSKITFKRRKHLAGEVRQAFSENISHFCLVSAVIWEQDEDKWFQNYKSYDFSSSLHSVWSLYRTERLIGAKCWIWTCSNALWCIPLFPLFPLLAFIKYFCKTQTCVLKTSLVPNGGNPSLLSSQKHLFTCHIKHIWLQTSMKAKSRRALVWWKLALWAFLRVKAENKAEQQLLHARANLKQLFMPPSRHDAHWDVC